MVNAMAFLLAANYTSSHRAMDDKESLSLTLHEHTLLISNLVFEQPSVAVANIPSVLWETMISTYFG